jgi:Protein of unknown function (DUF3405)
MSNNKKTAILLLTHIEDRRIQSLFSDITENCREKYDVFFLCDNSTGKFSQYSANKNYFLFDTSKMVGLGYPGKSASNILSGENPTDSYHKKFHFDPGHVELPVLLFFKAHPEYAYYWTIEYDVRFTGSWDRLFAHFEDSDADLLGTTLTRRHEIPAWHHWSSLDVAAKDIGPESYLRGFFPIYRLSHGGLSQLDRDYHDGAKGHFECLIPTLLHNAGLTIEDIGGDGEFVKPANRNRFYRNTPRRGPLSPGTFVYRPVRHRPGKERNMLWHPIKYIPLWKVGMDRMRRIVESAAVRVQQPGFRRPPPKIEPTRQ